MIKYGIIVIYNQIVDKVETYSKFKDQLKLVVVDNSSDRQIVDLNQQKVIDDGHIFLGMNGNKGLSKAYNAAITYLKHRDRDFYYVLIMDDDTGFESDFIAKANQEIKEHPASIYLPIVKSNGMIISPCKIVNNKISRIDSNSKDIRPEQITGINSGMIVSIHVYEAVSYNENLFLDYIDHDFIKQAKKRSFSIRILNQTIYQNFSIFNDDLESTVFRLKILKKDLDTFYLNGIYNRFLYHSTMTKRKLRAVKRFKNLSILWKC